MEIKNCIKKTASRRKYLFFIVVVFFNKSLCCSRVAGGQGSGARVRAKWRPGMSHQGRQRGRPELPKLHTTRWVTHSAQTVPFSFFDKVLTQSVHALYSFSLWRNRGFLYLKKKKNLFIMSIYRVLRFSSLSKWRLAYPRQIFHNRRLARQYFAIEFQ